MLERTLLSSLKRRHFFGSLDCKEPVFQGSEEKTFQAKERDGANIQEWKKLTGVFKNTRVAVPSELGGLKGEASEGERTVVCSPGLNYDRRVSEGN